jgi:nicotinamidase-related amidase
MAGEFVESQVPNLHPLTNGGERMELSLDPKVTALVLIDLQRGIVGRQAAADVVRNGVRLADALRAKGGLVVFVRVNISEVLSVPVDAPTPRPANVPPDASELVPELNVQAGDVVVTKRQWGAFCGTDLEQQLRRRQIRTVVMRGIATNIGVESTARAAYDRGYELVFAEDAMSSVSGEAHGFAVSTIFSTDGPCAVDRAGADGDWLMSISRRRGYG